MHIYQANKKLLYGTIQEIIHDSVLAVALCDEAFNNSSGALWQARMAANHWNCTSQMVCGSWVLAFLYLLYYIASTGKTSNAKQEDPLTAANKEYINNFLDVTYFQAWRLP